MMLGTVIPAPYRWLAIAGLALALFLFGWFKGSQSVHAKWDAAIAEQAIQTANVVIKQGEATIKVVTQYVDRIKVVRERGETITKEIPVYVPVDSCPLPAGFRVLHDAAAIGTIPDPARIADAEPAPAQDVAATVTSNYGTCHEIREQLIGLQHWVGEQKRISDEAAEQ